MCGGASVQRVASLGDVTGSGCERRGPGSPSGLHSYRRSDLLPCESEIFGCKEQKCNSH